MSFFSTLLAIISLVAVCAGLPSHTGDTSTPLPPSEDPWYAAPANYASAAPGAILKTRVAPGNITTVTGAGKAYNLLYRTTDSHGNPSWAVTTILIPKTAYSAQSKKALLSYQIHYDSPWIDASPSYAMYSSTPSDINTALGKGWYVNVPDYETYLASFTAGTQSGQATLDSVRAVLKAGLGVTSSNSRYAMWGYSGGALASEWAAELQPTYASELSFSGAALGGLTPNITNVFFSCTGSLSAGLLPLGTLGLVSIWPDANTTMYEELKNGTTGTYTATNFLKAKTMTLSEAESAYELQNIFNYFEDGKAFLNTPAVAEAISVDGIMGQHSTPKMPIYAYKAIHDEVSPIADTDKLINEYCDKGANILYERNLISGHGAEETNGDPAATQFLNSVFNGTYASHYNATGCTIRNVYVAIDPSPLKE